jgi:hypothetical protein
MKIRVIGGGWYGCHLAAALLAEGHDVDIHEIEHQLFSGASGGNPARLHLGFHYPRSAETRQACRQHLSRFMEVYGHITRGVPVNIYAVAREASQVDFGTYQQIFRGELEFVTVENLAEFGLQHIEGAVLTGERHIVIDEAREHFDRLLAGRVCFNQPAGDLQDPHWDLTIDCTFSALDSERIDRYEPCLTVLLAGTADRALTVMDGPFPSIYPWDERRNLSSLTSAKLTPISKECRTYEQAKAILNQQSAVDLGARARAMVQQMAEFWPSSKDRYAIADFKTSIRAMPRSAADTRLSTVSRVGDRAIRVRAGKIDAVFHAEKLVMEHIRGAKRQITEAMVA